MSKDPLIKTFLRMFKCDSARIVSFPGQLFLIIGYKRNTRDGHMRWMRNGKPYDFEYLAEQPVASGRNRVELTRAARAYRRMLGSRVHQTQFPFVADVVMQPPAGRFRNSLAQ